MKYDKLGVQNALILIADRRAIRSAWWLRSSFCLCWTGLSKNESYHAHGARTRRGICRSDPRVRISRRRDNEIESRTLRLTILFPRCWRHRPPGCSTFIPRTRIRQTAAEQAELNQAVNEANGSAVDLTRALEQHLRKYPNSPRRAEIEASLYKTAADSNDHPRIILYGETSSRRQAR